MPIETVEVFTPTVTDKNKHRVSKAQWRKWSEKAREVFNEVYGSMKESQYAYTHPELVEMPAELWNTTCWNAAWCAADAVDR